MRLIGAISLALNAVLLALMLRAGFSRARYNHFVLPVLAMELVRSPDDIRQVFADVRECQDTTPDEFFSAG